ncbi:BNR repeat-containing protein [Paraprevotella xylaniphila]|uniref:BNR repeat-containing protein n=1 Tax=Paraprevotella xylaniphila TaxID=454155 RepID=UPI0039F4EF8E
MKNLLLIAVTLWVGFVGTAAAQNHLSPAEATVYEGKKLADEGAWCWFADPRALHYENESGTINSSYVGYIDVHGAVKAVQYDFLKGRRSEVLVRSYFQPDDHNNPTFLVLPDERIMIFYSRHTDEPCFYYRISRAPGDITTLGEERKILTKDNTTYPSPFILSDDPEHIYLCWRGIRWHPTIARLSLPDENDEVQIDWGPYQMVQSTGARPYAKYYSNGKDRIMFTYTTGHPDNENPNWLYLNSVNIKTLQLEDVQGKVLSTIADGPFKVNRTEQYAVDFPVAVVDHTPGVRDWVWQVATDKQGHPVIAMVKISGDKTRHDYYYKYWDGQAWKEIFLAHAGGHFHQTPDIERCYSGGMAIDPAHPEVVYCSVPVSGAFGRVYEIVKYTVDVRSGDVKAEPVTRHSRKNNVRPYILPDSESSPLRLAWMHGDYFDWIVSSARPGYPTSVYGDFRWTEEPVDLDKGVVAGKCAAGGQMQEKGKGIKVDVPREWQKGDFTVFISVATDGMPLHGTVCEADGWSWAADSVSFKPCLTIGQKAVRSCNVLGTADSWSRYGRGTNGKWYPVVPYPRLALAVVSENGRLTTYVNGLVDQTIEGDCGLRRLVLDACNGRMESYTVYHRALNPDEIARLGSRGY